MIWKVFLILALVVANGFFVAAEFALVKVRLSEVRLAALEGSRTAKMVERLLLRLDASLSACQLGITLASLGLGWVGEPLVARTLEPIFEAWAIPAENVHFFSFPIAFLIITFLHITAGEQAPKIAAIRKAQPTAQIVSLPLFLFFKIFQPFIWLLNTSSNLMLRVVGIKVEDGHDEAPTEDQLRLLMGDSRAAGEVTMREHTIMENVLDLEEKIARRYMVSRGQIVFINRNDPIDQKVKKAAESGHTRLPLCEDDLDHIIGIVHVKDVLQAMVAEEQPTALDGMAREPLYAPETITLDRLLHRFQRERSILAVLVDEYGTVSGLITVADVIEELVGPIDDEFDSDEPMIIMRAPDRYEVDALCPISEAIEKLNLRMPETEVDTLGGLVTDLIGHIPEKGETVTVGDCQITVLEAEGTRPRRLLVSRRSSNPHETTTTEA